MTRDIIIGVDSGTSLIKSVAFTTTGEQIAVVALPNDYATLADGGVEQDLRKTWADCAATLRQLAEKVPNLAARVAAIGVTAQGDGTWLIDRDGEPVAPGWLWLDSRAAAIAEAVIEHPDYPTHYETTGTGVNACQQNVQLAWLKRNRPEIIARAATAMHCKDWLYFKLTGDRVTDPSEANFTFGNFRTRQYKPEILRILGAAECERLLPRIVDGTREAGKLRADVVSATGLPEGIPVMLGFLDVVCTGLGGGLFDRGGTVGCTIVGSTGMHMRLAMSPAAVRLNAERSGYTMAFPVPEACAQMQSNMAGTLNIDWLLDIGREVLATAGLERSRKDLLSGMDDRVLAAPAGSALYHPYISQAGERGPFLEPSARAQFVGLQSETGYFALMRAIYEGLCFAARDCYAAMGATPAEIRLAGGAARSRALRTILASVLGAPVRTAAREEAGAAGAAMIAAVQLGIYRDMPACVAAWVDPLLGPPEAPDGGLAAAYDRLFPVYVETRKAMRPLWRSLRRAKQEERR
jgi:erythritol kinase